MWRYSLFGSFPSVRANHPFVISRESSRSQRQNYYVSTSPTYQVSELCFNYYSLTFYSTSVCQRISMPIFFRQRRHQPLWVKRVQSGYLRRSLPAGLWRAVGRKPRSGVPTTRPVSRVRARLNTSLLRRCHNGVSFQQCAWCNSAAGSAPGCHGIARGVPAALRCHTVVTVANA